MSIDERPFCDDVARLVDRSGRPLRILIVENEALTALDYALTIEEAGAQVIGTASSAVAAEHLAKALHPDLILMDVRLTGDKDGIDAAHAIRAFSGAPVLFVTGNTEPGTRARIRAFDGSTHVDKPVEPKALVAALASFAG